MVVYSVEAAGWRRSFRILTSQAPGPNQISRDPTISSSASTIHPEAIEMRGLSTSPSDRPLLPLYQSHASSPLAEHPSRLTQEAASTSLPYRDSIDSASERPSNSILAQNTRQATARTRSPISPPPSILVASGVFQPLQASSKAFSQPTSTTAETLRAIAREYTYASRNLQFLLDAQSRGLLAGLEGPPASAPAQEETARGHEGKDASSTRSTPLLSTYASRSSTPTLRAPRTFSPAASVHFSPPSRSTARQQGGSADHDHTSSSSPAPKRRRDRRPTLPLPQVRTEMTNTLRSLSILKTYEADNLAAALASQRKHLSALTSSETKRSALENKIHTLESDQRSGRPSIETLRQEEITLAREIQELENRLFEMRERQRRVKLEVEERTSRLDAKLSSYKGALEDLEKEGKRLFLERKPEDVDDGINGSKSGKGKIKAEDSVWDLPAERRTIGLVKDDLVQKVRSLEEGIEDASKEARASEEGARLWKEVVREVKHVETLARKGLGGGEAGASQVIREDDVKGLLADMDLAIGALEGKWKVSVDQGWSFLECAVAAELEALVQGRDILRGVLGEEEEKAGDEEDQDYRTLMASKPEGVPSGLPKEANFDTDGGGEQDGVLTAEDQAFMGGPLSEPDESPKSAIAPRRTQRVEHSDHDEPGPDFLIDTTGD
ncbi:hypothetical protein MMC25_002541 [Agyrium rufum]|nr:hypothetical protein [Agyrium rufum]